MRLVRVAERLFRLVLRLLPARLRERHGEEMAVDLRRLANRGRARSGAAGVAFVLVRACADVVMQAPVEHWREVTGADGTGSRHGARRERAGAVETVAADGYRALRLAVRALARRPGFAVVVVLTLGVGIGATAASFAVVRSVLIEPLPYPDSERIVMVEHHAPGLHLMESLGASPGMVDFYRGSAQSFSHMAIIRSRAARNLTGDERPARVRVVEASPDVFAVLGVRPARGRAFGGVDIEPGAEPVAVLTHAGWRSHFGGDEDVVGRTVELGGIPTRIVGIMPEGFHYPDPETVALLPRSVGPEPAFGDFGIGAIARLAPDVTLEEARREVAALQRRIPDVFPDEMTSEFLERSGWRASVVPLRDLEVRDVESTLWIVLGTVGFVLLIACAGVANLFLVRMDGRRAEFAVRAALGAGRARLAGLFASEGVLLGLGGGIVGGALSVAGVRAIVAAEPPGLPRLHEIAVEPATVGCVVGLGVVAGLALGLLPFARMAGAIGDGGALPQARGGIGAPERQRTRRVLIAGQVALALVLLTGSGLMLRSFERLRAVDPGVDPEGVLTVGVSPGDDAGPGDAASFYERVRERVAAVPGVDAVGITDGLPIHGSSISGAPTEAESRPAADDEIPRTALFAAVSPGYFEAMGIRRIDGRGVEPEDHAFARRVAWVNETFVRRLVDGEPLGQRIRLLGDSTWLEIVGVVQDVRQLGLHEPVRPTFYYPMTVLPTRSDLASAHLVLHTSAGDPLALVPAVRRAVDGIRDDVPLTSPRTMESIIRRSMARTSFTAAVLSIAAAIALFLGAVGLYGIISYAVSRRRREIGLRIALGARPGDVRRLVVRQGAAVIAFGILAGLAAATALTRLMDGLLFEISAADPIAFGAATAALVAVGLIASWLPARHASTVAPMDTLRAD